MSNDPNRQMHVPDGQGRPDPKAMTDGELATRIRTGTLVVNQMYAEIAVQQERGHEPLEETVEMLRKHERYLEMLRDERRGRMGKDG